MFKKPTGALCKQSHVDSKTFSRICQKLLREPVRYHRKLWEYVYILRILEQFDLLRPGVLGIGFGCGEERLVPTLAARGAKVLVTDLEGGQAAQRGWVETGQHSYSLEAWNKYLPHVCDADVFKMNVRHAFVDMTNIPRELMTGGFDFTWSSCSLEHLGNLQKGIDFVLDSLETLKPGGIAIHTTEYNVSSNDDTVESGSTSIYRRTDLQRLFAEAKRRGFVVGPMDWGSGDLLNDNHVDVPPYTQDPHLKLKIQEYVCTSVGFFIRRKA